MYVPYTLENYMDRIWRWRHRLFPETVNNFPRYANSRRTRYKKPFLNILSRFWENRLTNCSVKKTDLILTSVDSFVPQILTKSADREFLHGFQKFWPIWPSLGPCIPFLTFELIRRSVDPGFPLKKIRPNRRSVNPWMCSKNLDRFARPWVLVSLF